MLDRIVTGGDPRVKVDSVQESSEGQPIRLNVATILRPARAGWSLTTLFPLATASAFLDLWERVCSMSLHVGKNIDLGLAAAETIRERTK
jgi:hypothetical protein